MDELEPVPTAGVIEICSEVKGESAAVVAAAGGAGEDAAAFAACKADAAEPVASEPSASARLTRALPATGVCAADAPSPVDADDADDVDDGEEVCAAGRLAAAVPPPDAGDGALMPGTELGIEPAVALGAEADEFAAGVVADVGEVSFACAITDAAAVAGALPTASSASGAL